MKRNLTSLVCGVVILGLLANNALTVSRHHAQMTEILKEEGAAKDSLIRYISELTTTVDLLTDSKPLVFTAYNAMVSQTDDTPNITASNKEIFPGVLALSRELLKPYGHGGNISYGDTVWVVLPMQVEDTMNRRWRNRADVYMLDYQEALNFGRRHGRMYHPPERGVDMFASLVSQELSVLN